MTGTDDAQPATGLPAAAQPTDVKTGRWQQWQKIHTIKSRLYIVYTVGIGLSFSDLYLLAVKYGGWEKGIGLGMPVIIDVYWITALQIVLNSSRSKGQRIMAAFHAFFAIGLSISGNLLYHELDTGDWHLTGHALGQLVAVLACIPVVLTGTVTHLAVLAQQPAATPADTAPAEAEPAAAALPAEDGNRDVPPAAPAQRTIVVPDPVPARAQQNPAAAVPAGSANQESGQDAGSQNPGADKDAGSQNPAGGEAAAPENPGTGEDPGSQNPAGDNAPRRTAARPARPARPAGAAGAETEDEAEGLESRDAVNAEMAARPRQLKESPEDRERRALELVGEYLRRTGFTMTDGELGKALGKAKSFISGRDGLRAAIREREAEQEQSIRDETEQDPEKETAAA